MVRESRSNNNLIGVTLLQLAAHIKTRDSNSIRSHAQKHFIKMYRDNIPLPDKVCQKRKQNRGIAGGKG